MGDTWRFVGGRVRSLHPGSKVNGQRKGESKESGNWKGWGDVTLNLLLRASGAPIKDKDAQKLKVPGKELNRSEWEENGRQHHFRVCLYLKVLADTTALKVT